MLRSLVRDSVDDEKDEDNKTNWKVDIKAPLIKTAGIRSTRRGFRGYTQALTLQDVNSVKIPPSSGPVIRPSWETRAMSNASYDITYISKKGSLTGDHYSSQS